jgi:putative transposase
LRSRRDDSVLRERLIELAREKPRFGYWRFHVLLCHHEPEAHQSRESVARNVRRTRRKRLTLVPRPRPMLTAPNQEWAIDFDSKVSFRCTVRTKLGMLSL